MPTPMMIRAQAEWPRLPNFEIQKLLGEGSYGKVYKVRRIQDNQVYAIKEVDLAKMRCQEERNDAVNEIRLLCSINHVNVTRYHEAFLNGMKLYVVMEYAAFGELKYYIDKGRRLGTPFPEECVWRLFLQLARGLSAIHASKVIHRDIKPANIFLCHLDVVKIGDLGVAKALTQLQFTRTHIGTPLYMAPEVVSQRPYNYSSDMWSLGCVLYEMMTFKPPFGGNSLPDLENRIRMGRYEPIRPGTYSPELIAMAHSLLSVDPRKRPSADNILESSPAARWLKVLPAVANQQRRFSDNGGGRAPMRRASENGGGGLLNTILVPRDLRQLPKVLPPANYDDEGQPPAQAAGGPTGKPAQLIVPSPAPQAANRVPSPAGMPPPRAPSPRGAGIPSPGARPPVAAAINGAARAPGAPGNYPAGAPGNPLLQNRPPLPNNGLGGRVSENGGPRISENGGPRVSENGSRYSDNGGPRLFDNPARPRSGNNQAGVVLPALPTPRVSGDGGAGLKAPSPPPYGVLQPGVRPGARRSTYS